MGLPCVFVIGLLSPAIRPRLPVIGADVRQIREPHSGETANAFDAQGPDGPFLQDLGPVFERRLPYWYNLNYEENRALCYMCGICGPESYK